MAERKVHSADPKVLRTFNNSTLYEHLLNRQKIIGSLEGFRKRERFEEEEPSPFAVEKENILDPFINHIQKRVGVLEERKKRIEDLIIQY